MKSISYKEYENIMGNAVEGQLFEAGGVFCTSEITEDGRRFTATRTQPVEYAVQYNTELRDELYTGRMAR